MKKRTKRKRRYEIHELAAQFPSMSALEYSALVESIGGPEGLREPLLLFEGKILDGRHRYRACLELGIEPSVRRFTGTRSQAEQLSVDQNLSRRHLSASQKAMIIAMHGMAAKPKSDDAENNGKLSIRDASKRYGVNHMMIYKAFSILGSDMELAQNVFRGEISLTKAMSAIKNHTKKSSRSPRRKPNPVHRSLLKLREFTNKELKVSDRLAKKIDGAVDHLVQLLESAE